MGVGLSFCFHSNISGLWWVSNGVVTQGDRLNAMATPTVTLNDVRQTLKKWDKGSRSVRESILCDFIEQCEGMTAPELEQQFCDCASLFLARLTAWIRLTYMVGTCVELQLKAITIFISAASGQHFLTEFLEVGGMLTVLEIVGLRSTKEGNKAMALQLLTTIACRGRQYKELLCESYGVKLVAECLALSSAEETQERARNLLYQLSTGNPHYQSQVYKTLVALLSSTSSEAQRMAAYTLRLIQPSMGVASGSIVEPALQLLRSLHVDVQHEAAELLQDLVGYEEVQEPILTGLVGMLKASDEGSAPKHAIESDTPSQAPLPVYIQQAGAAKTISMLASRSKELSERLLEMRVVPHLLYSMGNTSYIDSQRQAAVALAVFVKEFASVKEQVTSIMGADFLQQFMNAPEKLYSILTPSQIDVLVASLGQDVEAT